MKRLEQITTHYWEVSYALRGPSAQMMRTGEAFDKLNEGTTHIRPEEYKLHGLLHTLTNDIIEGNKQWQRKNREQKQDVSASILHMNW